MTDESREERITAPPSPLLKVRVFRTIEGVRRFKGDASCIEVEPSSSGFQVSEDREGRTCILDIDGGVLLSAEGGCTQRGGLAAYRKNDRRSLRARERAHGPEHLPLTADD